jgi:hypothetical protein
MPSDDIRRRDLSPFVTFRVRWVTRKEDAGWIATIQIAGEPVETKDFGDVDLAYQWSWCRCIEWAEAMKWVRDEQREDVVENAVEGLKKILLDQKEIHG